MLGLHRASAHTLNLATALTQLCASAIGRGSSSVVPGARTAHHLLKRRDWNCLVSSWTSGVMWGTSSLRHKWLNVGSADNGIERGRSDTGWPVEDEGSTHE